VGVTEAELVPCNFFKKGKKNFEHPAEGSDITPEHLEAEI
jgi:hypothetical protein